MGPVQPFSLWSDLHLTRMIPEHDRLDQYDPDSRTERHGSGDIVFLEVFERTGKML